MFNEDLLRTAWVGICDARPNKCDILFLSLQQAIAPCSTFFSNPNSCPGFSRNGRKKRAAGDESVFVVGGESLLSFREILKTQLQLLRVTLIKHS